VNLLSFWWIRFDSIFCCLGNGENPEDIKELTKFGINLTEVKRTLRPLDLKHFWEVLSNIFYFHIYLGKIPILTNIFQRGWNHQLEFVRIVNDVNAWGSCSGGERCVTYMQLVNEICPPAPPKKDALNTSPKHCELRDTLLYTNIAMMEDTPFWWRLLGNIRIFYVTMLVYRREPGTLQASFFRGEPSNLGSLATYLASRIPCMKHGRYIFLGRKCLKFKQNTWIFFWLSTTT